MNFLDIYDNISALIEPGPYELRCRYLNQVISIRLTRKELILYINGSVADRADTVLRPRQNAPLLVGFVKDGDESHLVEVFGKSGWLRGKIKVYIDNVKVAGDEF